MASIYYLQTSDPAMAICVPDWQKGHIAAVSHEEAYLSPGDFTAPDPLKPSEMQEAEGVARLHGLTLQTAHLVAVRRMPDCEQDRKRDHHYRKTGDVAVCRGRGRGVRRSHIREGMHSENSLSRNPRLPGRLLQRRKWRYQASEIPQRGAFVPPTGVPFPPARGADSRTSFSAKPWPARNPMTPPGTSGPSRRRVF
ncbi:MAG: hypothetical protein IT210_00965 [Armatimonadetes bacterium]|nr:hypothetical protein [Armatimonadota bacterium]